MSTTASSRISFSRMCSLTTAISSNIITTPLPNHRRTFNFNCWTTRSCSMPPLNIYWLLPTIKIRLLSVEPITRRRTLVLWNEWSRITTPIRRPQFSLPPRLICPRHRRHRPTATQRIQIRLFINRLPTFINQIEPWKPPACQAPTRMACWTTRPINIQMRISTTRLRLGNVWNRLTKASRSCSITRRLPRAIRLNSRQIGTYRRRRQLQQWALIWPQTRLPTPTSLPSRKTTITVILIKNFERKISMRIISLVNLTTTTN